jgi:hypothetical protein
MLAQRYRPAIRPIDFIYTMLRHYRISEEVGKPTATRLQRIRSMQALTYIGTPEAKKIIESLR